MLNMPNFKGVKVVASGWPRLELLNHKNRYFYDERVAEILLAIIPLFPTPHNITFD